MTSASVRRQATTVFQHAGPHTTYVNASKFDSPGRCAKFMAHSCYTTLDPQPPDLPTYERPHDLTICDHHLKILGPAADSKGS